VTKRLGSKDRRSARDLRRGGDERTNVEQRRNFGKKFVERLGSYATFRAEARDGSSPSARAARRGIALPFTRRRLHLDGALIRELRAELGQSNSTFPRIDSYRPESDLYAVATSYSFACGPKIPLAKRFRFARYPRKLLKSLGREIYDFEGFVRFQ